MSGTTRADFGKLRKQADALAYNEAVTRKRLDMLEGRSVDLERLALPVSKLIQRSFMGRLRWLLTGR